MRLTRAEDEVMVGMERSAFLRDLRAAYLRERDTRKLDGRGECLCGLCWYVREHMPSHLWDYDYDHDG